ncbi:MAG: carbohydrate ABC transporter permease [Aggregatilineales bacterium]
MASHAIQFTDGRKRNPVARWLAADTLNGIKRQRAVMGYLFLAPTIIGLLVFIVVPMITSFVLSFYKWNVFKPPDFIGLANFTRLFADSRVLVSYENTIILVVMTIVVLESLALGLALAVYRLSSRALATFFRTAYFLPVLLSGAAVAVTLGYLFHQDFGVINYYLGQLGIQKVPWLTQPGWVLIAVSVTTVWRNLGFTFIIYLGGLSSLPPEVLEAADIDGAAGFQKLWRVILPLLSPTILFAVVTDIIKMLQFFDEPFIMTHGGPGDASRTVVMMMYDSAFGNLDFGYGSAIALSLFVIIMAVTGIQFYLSRRWVFYK